MNQPARILAPDWLRGFAVLVMVECHVFNALLAPVHRKTSWFTGLDWLNGLVAPAFLLVSGMMLGLNLEKRWSQGTSKLWRRVGQIFVVAYLLHLPTPLLWEFFGPRGAHLVALWTKMDILQCVAGSLGVILLLVPVTRRVRAHQWVCLGLGTVVTISGTWVAGWADGSAVPKFLLNYLWPTGVGLFPLVPWAGFVWIGVWLGPAIFRELTEARRALRAAIAGLFFVVAAQFMVVTEPYGAAFVFARIGWVLIALAACCGLREPVRGTKWILQFGQLSLWSYTVHLVIVYGSGISLGLDSLGARFAPPVALAALAAVLGVTAWVVKWRAKALQEQAALRIMRASQ